jgi:hypothetical protein
MALSHGYTGYAAKNSPYPGRTVARRSVTHSRLVAASNRHVAKPPDFRL